MQRIFRGRFRLAYLFVKTVALYAGTFAVCYFWPQFLNFIVDPPPLPALETLALLPPVGFLVLGVALGKRVFLAHFGILMVAAPIAYLTASADDGAEGLLSRWIGVLLGCFVVGFWVGFREQVARHQADREEVLG